jgi:secretion/DNA translocation related TadE-like protein
VILLALLTAAGLVAAAALTVGSAVLARHRAQSAADLGALAGAAAAQRGEAQARVCAAVRSVVRVNAAELVACQVEVVVVLVRVRARSPGPRLLGGPRWASAAARAGPDTHGPSGNR